MLLINYDCRIYVFYSLFSSIFTCCSVLTISDILSLFKFHSDSTFSEDIVFICFYYMWSIYLPTSTRGLFSFLVDVVLRGLTFYIKISDNNFGSFVGYKFSFYNYSFSFVYSVTFASLVISFLISESIWGGFCFTIKRFWVDLSRLSLTCCGLISSRSIACSFSILLDFCFDSYSDSSYLIY